MRYRCQYCDKWVKDKFIFGLLHICLADEEKAAMIDERRKFVNSISENQRQFQQQSPFKPYSDKEGL